MIDYRPDNAQDKPSVLSTCKFVIADKNGLYRSSFGAATANLDNALNNTCLGSRMLRNASGNAFLFAGTATKLYSVNSGAATDVTRTVGGAYAATAWWFEQFGNEFIACNIADATQTSTGSNFAALAGAPKAAVMIAQQGHLLALNYDDGSAVPNGIKWASQNSSTTWTAAVGNTAGTATLVETPGKIVGGAAIHDVVVVWKRRSMYVGQRVGGSLVWEFKLLSPYIGLAGQESWVATPAGIIFASDNGMYLYDGSVPRPLDSGIRGTIFRDFSANASGAVMSHDEASSTVYLWNPTIHSCYAYNYISDRWSVAYDAVGGVTALGGSTYNDFKMAVRDSDFTDFVLSLGGPSNGSRRCHLVWSSENKCCNLRNLAGSTNIDPTFTVQTVRDPKASPKDDTVLEEVIPIFGYSVGEGFLEPTTGTCSAIPRQRMSGGVGTTKTATLDSTKLRFDVGNMTANSHNVTMTFAAQAMVLADIGYTTLLDGKR